MSPNCHQQPVIANSCTPLIGSKTDFVQVAHHLQTTGAPASEGQVYSVLPIALAALLREAARDE
jgi:hypothetical protein